MRYLIAIMILCACSKTIAQSLTVTKPSFNSLKDIIEKDISWPQRKDLVSRIKPVKKEVIIRICCQSKGKQSHPLFVLMADGKSFHSDATDSLTVTSILRSIQPSWVQSFEVLKDADEIHKYGLLAKNGVVLLSLKKGTLAKMPRDLRDKFKND